MLIIVFTIAAGIAYRLDTQGIWRPAPAGLLEHVSLLARFGWLIAIGIYLHRNGTVLPRATSTGTQQQGLPEPHGIVMKVCKDGQAWYAYRATPAGHIFGIAASEKPPQWFLDGSRPPSGYPSKKSGWTSSMELERPEWREEARNIPLTISAVR